MRSLHCIRDENDGDEIASLRYDDKTIVIALLCSPNCQASYVASLL